MGSVLGVDSFDDGLVLYLDGAPGEGMAGVVQVGKVLGKGTSGHVCAALERGTGAMVAVKIVRKSASQPGFIGKFGPELVRSVLELRHENVVRVRAMAEDEATMYLVMDLCRGPELFEVLKRAPLPERQAARVISQILGAVEYIHWAGLLHRDIKPENFMFDSTRLETLKLIDFGTVVYSSDEPMNEVIGSVGFCAPEVFSGGCCSASDIFSSGVIVALVLTGAWPGFLRPEAWMPSDNKLSDSQYTIGSYRRAVTTMERENVRRWASATVSEEWASYRGPLTALLDPSPVGRPEASAARELCASAAADVAARSRMMKMGPAGAPAGCGGCLLALTPRAPQQPKQGQATPRIRTIGFSAQDLA